MDENLRFQHNTSMLIKKAFVSLKLLFNNREFLTRCTKKTLCDALVLSNFNYMDVVYNSRIRLADSNRIQRIQNSCLRLIYGIRRRERIGRKMEECGWLSMKQRRDLHSVIFCYNIYLSKKPPFLYRKINFRSEVHNVNVRSRGLLTIPSHRLELFKDSFSYVVAKLLNMVFTNYGFGVSIRTLKYKYKQFLVHNS